jgi:hypothetical protein
LTGANKSCGIKPTAVAANVKPYHHRGTLACLDRKKQDMNTIFVIIYKNGRYHLLLNKFLAT